MPLTTQVLEKQLDLQTVLERICVRPPYFAINNLKHDGSSLEATAVAETPGGFELGPMSAAELGRHTAIAGLCCAALAQTDNRRRYYLAQQAECNFYHNNAAFGSVIHLRAELHDFGKRQARAVITATAQARPLASFDITYTILTVETFQRLFSSRRQNTPAVANPYTKPLPGQLERGDGWATSKLANVPASACAGHFENFPALPVAILMGQLSGLAGQTLAQPQVPYRVMYGSIVAKDLCWAGESAEFRVERNKRVDAQQHFNCTVVAEERIAGSMNLVLEAV